MTVPWRSYTHPDTGQVVHDFGWVRDPVKVQEFLDTLDQPYFADAAAHLMQATDPNQNALLWEACKKVTGDVLPAHNQKDVGCCVSEGWSSGLEYATCVEIAMGKPLEYKTVSHSAVYGLAREVGGMLGGGDGSTGSDAAKAVSQYGVCSCDEAGDRNDDPAFARAWGRSGVPQAVKDKCKPHLAQVSQVTTADQAKTALQNGYPVPIASDQGFSMTRDNDGYCRAQGSWNHEMCLIGYRADSNRFCILQSWGAGTPSGPTSLGQPDCSFWADYQVVNRMLGQRDSYAISVYSGYESRVLNWLI